MAGRAELLAEAQRRGLAVRPAPDELRAEAIRRGLITAPQPQSAPADDAAQPQGALTEPQVRQMVQSGAINPQIGKFALDEIAKGGQLTMVDGDIRRVEATGTQFERPGVARQAGEGFRKGIRDVGRGVGALAPETLQEDVSRLEGVPDDFFAASIGGVVGEALPFVPLAAIGPAAGVTSFLGRTLASAGLGATEGAVISRGQGAGEVEQGIAAGIGGTIGGAAEALLPSFGKFVSRVYKKLGRKPSGQLINADGTPTAEFQAALDETGTNFDDIAKESVDSLRAQGAGVDPAQAARAARFESQAIPAMAGDITQDFGQQAEEQRLVSMVTGAEGEPLRQARLEQSEAFVRSVEGLVDDLGVPKRTGDSVKEALSGRKDLLRAEKNALYKEVADAAPEVANVPIFTDEISKALPADRDMRRLRRLTPNTVDAVDDLLVEFGIKKNPEAVAAFTKDGGEITPLSLGNSEEFRQALGQIDRADTTGATKVVTGPIRKALDEEAAFIDDAVRESGITDEGIIRTLKEARGRVRTLKTEFSPQAITGRLVGVKRDGVTPIIEASKVSQELLRPNAPIENLRRTLQSLRDSGPKGKKAVQDMRASVVMDALESALAAPSRKTSGIETIGGNQFAKALSKFGDDKLDLLFTGNERALNSLRNLKQTALDISPAAGAVPKGSAAVILDIANRVGRLPGLAAMVDVGKFVVSAGADERSVRKALDASPDMVEKVSKLRQSFPGIVSALGIPAALEQENE